jgi:two-component system alkaline phosphatase synthesis response regulator PhoP
MMVEDDLTLSGLYKMRMESEGFEVLQCSNGESALEEAKKFKPQLIVMDIMMPKLNGFDAIDILRQTPETKLTKIIVLSAMSQPADQQRATDLGADEYLVKSQVVIADVMAVIRRHLGLPEQTSEKS